MDQEQVREIVREEIEKVQHKLIGKVTLKAKEAAAYLGISDEQIRIMARANEIPHFKMRSEYFFRKETLDAWMSAQEGYIVKQDPDIESQSEKRNKKIDNMRIIEEIKTLLDSLND